MQNKYSLLVFLLFSSFFSKGQSVTVPLNPDYYHLIDRLEIKRGRLSEGFQSATKGLPRKGIVQLTDSLLQSGPTNLSGTDLDIIQYLRNDSWEWANDPESESPKPFWNFLYKKKADAVSIHDEDVDLHVSPVFDFNVGLDSPKSPNLIFLNTRGVEVRGMLSQRLGFYSILTENQAQLTSYVKSYVDYYNQNEAYLPIENNIQGMPSESSAKYFKKSATAADFFSVRGYFIFNAFKGLSLQFGHDRQFIGNGFRSLILSDNAAPFLFLKLMATYGRIQYTSLYAQFFNLDRTTVNNKILPKKYATFHHLGLNLGKNTNIGLFEGVVFNRPNGDFEFNYLNPVIFLRALESSIGSDDNAIIGLDFKTNFKKHFSVYGQVFIDEFLIKEITANTGYWANKYGLQLGAKYIDVLGVRNLDLQVEANIVRPYTYSHFTRAANYANYGQPLAHPLGANFVEYLGILRYQPFQKLTVTGILSVMNFGADPNGQNWGGNINLSYFDRSRLVLFQDDYNNKIGQGVTTTTTFLDLKASYMLKHNLFLDVHGIFRNYNSANQSLSNNLSVVSLGLRFNVPYRMLVY